MNMVCVLHYKPNNARRTPSDGLSISSQLLDLVRRNETNPYLIDSDRTTAAQLTNASAEADPTTAKREVQMHKKILLSDIIIGPNKKGIAESSLLVPEDVNSNKVREYIKAKGGKYFYCVGCNNNKKQNLGKIEDIHFFAPVIHAQKCLAISKQEGEGELKNNIQKPTISNTASNDAMIQQFDVYETSALMENDESPKTSESPSPQVLPEVKQTGTKIAINEHDVLTPPLRLRAKKREAEETIPILMKQQKIVVDGFIADDYERNLSATSQQENEHLILTESLTPKSIYKFNHPSTLWLRNACEKLKLIYTQNAYKFWGNIDMTEIKETSKPRYVQKVKSGKDSSFCGLSYLLSGEENESIKTVIKNYFYDYFRSLDLNCGRA